MKDLQFKIILIQTLIHILSHEGMAISRICAEMSKRRIPQYFCNMNPNLLDNICVLND
jgi:hypothetical protein